MDLDRALLQVEDLDVAVGGFVLRGIDLELACGEYFVLLGPTGAGKTILLETIAGLYAPRGGRIVLEGRELTGLPPEERAIGLVYQDYALFPHLSLGENLAFGLRARRLGRSAILKRVEALAGLLGIGALLERHPSELSGGEAQRGALARALAVAPRLLLLDEPLSALDPQTRHSLQRELARVHRELGTTTLHVTHDFEEAVSLGERIGVMREGEILQVGSGHEVFRLPATAFVAEFVGAQNIFSGDVRCEGDRVVFTGEGLEMVVVTDRRGPAHAAIRPEEILVSCEPVRSSARNVFFGTISELVDRGVLVYVFVESAAAFSAAVTRPAAEEMGLARGRTVYLAFKASAVHVF